MKVFEAKYDGRCQAEVCTYEDHVVRQGDSCVYLDDELMHQACARRQQAEAEVPICGSCWQQHRGECP